MTDQVDAAGLFGSPGISAIFSGTALEPDDDLSTNGSNISVSALETVMVALGPVWRALTLCGWQPSTYLMARAPVSDVAATIEVPLDHSQTASVGFDEFGFQTIDWAVDGSGFVVLVKVFPYVSQLGLVHALTLPEPAGGETSAGWQFLGGPPEPNAAATLRLFVPGTVADDSIAQALTDGPVAAFTAVALDLLEARWAAGALDDVGGLLWLFDPLQWFPDSYGSIRDVVRLQKIGESGNPGPDVDTQTVRTFLADQISGQAGVRDSMLTATGRKLRSRRRARVFLKVIKQWLAGDEPPGGVLPDGFDVGAADLTWIETLALFVEARVLRPPALPPRLDSLYAEPIEWEFEPLIAVATGDFSVELRHFDEAGADLGEPYFPIVSLTGAQISEPSTEVFDQITAAPRPFEEMVTWEYIPAEADTPAQLIIVACPGVQVTEIGTPPCQVNVFRKQDYGIPQQGARIDLTRLFQPISLAGPQVENPVGYMNQPMVVIEALPDGHKITHFLDVPDLSAAQDAADAAHIDATPTIEIELKLTDPKSGSAGYRIEVDFIEADPEPVSTWSLLAAIRVLMTDQGVTLKITETTGSLTNRYSDFRAIKTAALSDVFQTWPQALPVITPVVFLKATGIGNTQWQSSEIRFADDLAPIRTVAETDIAAPYHVMEPMEDFPVEASFTAADLMIIPLDVAIGLTPVGLAIDVVEFANAYATGRDKWNRPVTTFDLYLMAVAIGLPISGSLAAQMRRGVSVASRVWIPPVGGGIADQTSTLLQASRTGDDAADFAAQAVVVFRAAAGSFSTNLAGAAVTAKNFMNGSGKAFLDPMMEFEYRKWMSRGLWLEGAA